MPQLSDLELLKKSLLLLKIAACEKYTTSKLVILAKESLNHCPTPMVSFFKTSKKNPSLLNNWRKCMLYQAIMNSYLAKEPNCIKKWV
jgi:hypothetical protein